MRIVWMVFLATALVLASLGVVALRRRGGQADVYRLVGKELLLLGLCTALFPAALGSVGPVVWAGAYVGLVAVATAVTTWRAVSRARAKSA